MEEMLIEYVRANPVLYDPTNRDYRNQQSRKEAWDEIGEKLAIPGNDCKDNWNKLRNAYIQSKNRRATKSGQAAKNFSKWKFEDEMAFVNRTLVPRKTRGNTEHSPHDEDNDAKDGTQEESGLCPLEETDSQVVSNRTVLQLSESSQSNSPGNDLLQSAIPTRAEVIGDPTANVSDSPTHFAQPSAKPVRPCFGKRRLSSTVQEMVTVMKDNQRLRSQLLLQSAPAAPNNNVDDECELFFLSLAKSVKKLRPDEQIRVKMEVSNIVLGAALQAARGNSFQGDSQYSSTPSPHQSELSLDYSSESISSYTCQENQQNTFTNLL